MAGESPRRDQLVVDAPRFEHPHRDQPLLALPIFFPDEQQVVAKFIEVAIATLLDDQLNADLHGIHVNFHTHDDDGDLFLC
jgi:hypothetical protein